jgi:putative hydrolase of the HAD superfamily
VLDTLFFDGDQTLWDFDQQMRRALQATLDELRIRHPELATDKLDVESMVADRQAVGAEHRGRHVTMERLRRVSFERTLLHLDLRDDVLAEHLTRFYLEQRFSTIDLYPDTLAGLTALRTTYKLGLLSNGNTYPDRFGLGGLFTTVVFAQEHGFTKPDQRLFDLAVAKIGSSAASTAMVGDSLVNDVVGAQRAGWLGIWLNRGSAVRPPDHQPDAEISTLTQLPTVVAELNRQCLALRDQTKQ